MAEARDFRKDMARMEQLFATVKRQYDLFFAGAAREPPKADHEELGRLVRYWSTAGISQTAQQFLFQSFQNRYLLHHEQWTKWMRAREDGLVSDPRLPMALRKARSAFQELEKGVVKESARKASVQAPKKEKTPPFDPARKLYEEFTAAKREAGEAATLNFEAFQAFVEKQKAAIVQKYGARKVDFTVAVKDGKVTLKAKMVK